MAARSGRHRLKSVPRLARRRTGAATAGVGAAMLSRSTAAGARDSLAIIAIVVPTGTFFAFGHEQFGHRAGLENFDLDVGLVGLDDHHDLAPLDVVSGLDEPLGDAPSVMSAPSDGIRNSVVDALRAHRLAGLRGLSMAAWAAADARDARHRSLFEMVRVRQWQLGGADAADRGVELEERLLHDRAATSPDSPTERHPSSTTRA